jgi:hypothetical protein
VSASGNRAGRQRRGVVIALLLVLLPLRPGAGLEAQGAERPTSPPAHVVLVTAGEHGGFSRVVFALGADLPYRAEPEPAGLRVVFPGARVGFEYGEVYPKQRAHRVIMVEPGSDADGGSLRLRFGCDCSARTFMLDDRLVVDIFDAASSAGQSPFSRAAPAGRAPPASERLAGAAAGPAVADDVADASDQGQPRPEFVQRVQSLNSSAPGARSGVVPDDAAFNPDHLQRMLAWAVEQGHLTGVADSDDRAPEPPGPEDTQALAAGAAAPGATQPSAPTEQPASLPVAQAPAVAPEPSAAKQEPAAGSGTTESCPDGSALDMAVLGGTGAFAVEFARRQDALSRALAAGNGIPEAQHALAGFYLARLMPHEALRLLRTSDRQAPTPTGRWLEAVALVLVDRTGALAGGALQASSCQGADVQLWQAVLRAADGPIPPQALESEAIPLRLAAYPPDLRVELALRLAEAGIDAKTPEAIARFLDMVEQAAPAEEARARLLFLRGRLAAARGDFTGARASWREALHLPGEGGLRATLALLGWNLEHDVLDEAEALSALERLAYDWRGHPAQLSIARLTAAIHERQGRVSLALRAIEEVALGAEGRPSGRAAARLATDLMRRSYADVPSALPIDQLAVFWRYEGFVPPGSEGADIRLAFARALIAHSLPSSAIGLLEPLARDARDPAHDQVIDLLAESYLAANQPARALDLLRAAADEAPASRPDRNLLAARALAALGRFAEAAGVLHGNAAEEAAQLQADYLWKAGLWQETTTAYRELLRQQQGRADPERAVRLAAAAYMADQPALLERTHSAAGAGNDEVDTSAFAALPKPDSSATRTVAAQLLDQAASLSALAERYGLNGTQIP